MGMKAKWFPYLMVAPLVVVFLSFVGYPIIRSLWMSLTDYKLTGLRTNFIGAENYLAVFSDNGFWGSFWTTTQYVVLATTFEFVFGMLIALALQKQKRFTNTIRSLLIAPMFIAPIAVGLLFRFLLNSQLGIVPGVLNFIGIDHDFFGTGNALYSLVLIDIWQWTPFMILLLTAGLEALPKDPISAAKVDGAGPFFRFFHVTLPMLMPVISVAILLRALDAVRVYEYVFATTKGGPGQETVTVQYFIYQQGIQFFRLGYASAAAFILFLAIMIVTLVTLRKNMRKAA